MFHSINLKLGNARKEERYVIYPYNGDGFFIIQSDKRIARVDMDGKGTVSNPHSSGAYFVHLSFEKNPIQLTSAQIMDIKLKVLGAGEENKHHSGAISAPQNLTGITI
jgi:hypothetical protein